MAFIYADRVKETTTSTTATINLDGAVQGFRTFAATLAVGDTCEYCLTDGLNWEVGVGTLASSTTFTRATTVYSSTNSNNSIVLSGGIAEIFLTKAAYSSNDVITQPPVAITTTATLAVGNCYTCTGTTADYTITLPVATTNTDKIITIYIDDACTQLITVDVASAGTINGSTTRKMVGGESAVLKSNGTEWKKVAGKATHLYGVLSATSSSVQNTVGGATKVLSFDTVLGTVPAMGNISTDTITILRSGVYKVSGRVSCYPNAAAGAHSGTIFKNGATLNPIIDGVHHLTAGAQGCTVYPNATISLVAGDTITLYITPPTTASTNWQNAHLDVIESNPW